MKRLHAFALVLALMMLVALPSCKKSEAPRGDVIPAHATYTFSELRNFELRGDAVPHDPARLAALFAEDHVLHVAAEGGVRPLRDFVECVDGAMTLVHHIGEGGFHEQDGVTVFEGYVCERLPLGSYERREVTLTRPLYESGYVKDGELILSVLEPNGSSAYVYDLVFTKD